MLHIYENLSIQIQRLESGFGVRQKEWQGKKKKKRGMYQDSHLCLIFDIVGCLGDTTKQNLQNPIQL